MKTKKTITVFILIIIGLLSVTVKSQYEKTKKRINNSKPIVSTAKPTSVLDISSSIKYKLVSRKNIYHLDDLISVDYAILNSGNYPIFLQRRSQPQFFLVDQFNNAHKVISYFVTDTIVTKDIKENFFQLAPSDITNGVYLLLVGCNGVHKFNFSEDDTGIKVFETNQFISYGQACLDIRTPGEYTLLAEFDNSLAHDFNKIKSGKITRKIVSIPWTFKIIK